MTGEPVDPRLRAMLEGCAQALGRALAEDIDGAVSRLGPAVLEFENDPAFAREHANEVARLLEALKFAIRRPSASTLADRLLAVADRILTDDIAVRVALGEKPH